MRLITIIATLIFLVNPAPAEQAEMMWINSTDAERIEMPAEVQAYACGIATEEFIYLAQVIEAESDRNPEHMEGKIHIAAVILNRVNSPSWPDSIRGVLDQADQFATTSGGTCSMADTQSSRWAIIEAQRRLATGDIPENLIYFNCVGYNNGSAYGYIDGNYFMTA